MSQERSPPMVANGDRFGSFTKAPQHPSIHEHVPGRHHSIEQRWVASAPSHDQARRPVILREKEKGPTGNGAVWQRLTKHQCSLRLDLGNGHGLARLPEIRIGREADSVAHGQLLPRRNDAVGVLNVRAQQILDPFVRVETAAALPHLD